MSLKTFLVYFFLLKFFHDRTFNFIYEQLYEKLSYLMSYLIDQMPDYQNAQDIYIFSFPCLLELLEAPK